MKLRKSLIAAGLLLAYAGSAFGAISAEEAKKLGTSLTAVGAEMAGNADGSIPAYTGGLTKFPASFKPGSGKFTDPFADEKPLFSITGKNISQYAGQLTEGSKALLKKFPAYRLDVYKTHRTVVFADYVQKGTASSALTAKTTNGGVGIQNAKSGFPFPIPKDGYEAMWNHLVRCDGEAYSAEFSAWNVDASGRKTLSTTGTVLSEYPYWNRKNPSTDTYFMLRTNYTAPARRVGEGFMVKDPLNSGEKSRQAWQYLPGQRRVKMAPEISFDTPNPQTAGSTTYDDGYMFNGSMERYNMKLIGKREIYTPYNCYKAMFQTSSDALMGPKHINPDHVRWEKHRVWVVEATLKPGKRHIYNKRVFYLDEDGWTVLAADNYDARGTLFRTNTSLFIFGYDAKATFNPGIFSYDLLGGNYAFTAHFGDKGSYLKYGSPFKEREWSPDALAGSGVR